MFFGKFNRAKKIKKVEKLMQQDAIGAMAGMLMAAAKQPEEMQRKDFAELFAKAETAFLRSDYVKSLTAQDPTTLDTQEQKLGIIATSVVVAGILEGSIPQSSMEEIGILNILKQEALQKNVPWAYVNAYANNYLEK